jgi:hypothetical protein
MIGRKTKTLSNSIINLFPDKTKLWKQHFFKPYTKPKLGRWNIINGKKFMKLQEGKNYPY